MLKIITSAEKRFEPWARRFLEACVSVQYEPDVYDLGNLGFGKTLTYSRLREQLCLTGSYPARYRSWKMRACHKPEVILAAFRDYPDDLIAYFDADCVIRERIDEIIGDYDIGVTVRRQGELLQARSDQHPFMGQINAGVIFFRPSRSTQDFIELWKKKVESYRVDDQKALNEILNPGNNFLEPYTTKNIGNLRIKTFPTDIYNNYYFKEGISATAKILHFKGKKREESYDKYLTYLKNTIS